MNKPYTVLLRFPDYCGNWPDDQFWCHVAARDPKGALALAFTAAQKHCEEQKIELNGSAEEDFAMVAIFQGHCDIVASAATGV